MPENESPGHQLRSSSIKYQLYDARDFPVLASGLLEKIGENEEGRLVHRWHEPAGRLREAVSGGKVR